MKTILDLLKTIPENCTQLNIHGIDVQTISTEDAQKLLDRDPEDKCYHQCTLSNGSFIFTTHNKKLTRSRKERMIAGVCGGLAEYLGWDPTLVRIVYVLATIFTAFAGVIIYLILWIIMPEERYSDGYGDRMNQRLH